MTSSLTLPWRHHLPSHDVITDPPMTSWLTLPWRHHWPSHDVMTCPPMTSSLILPWRHDLPYHDVITYRPMTSWLTVPWRHHLPSHDVITISWLTNNIITYLKRVQSFIPVTQVIGVKFCVDIGGTQRILQTQEERRKIGAEIEREGKCNENI